jgi:hypothetical protein
MTTRAKLKRKTAAAVGICLASLAGTGVVVTMERGFAQAQAQRGAAKPAAPAAPAAATAQPGTPPAAVSEKAAARVHAAQQVVDALKQREEAGGPIGPAFIELKAGALRRLAEARIDAAASPADRQRAAEENVKQCREMFDLLESRRAVGADVTRVETSQAAYYVADAEYTLAKLQAMGRR